MLHSAGVLGSHVGYVFLTREDGCLDTQTVCYAQRTLPLRPVDVMDVNAGFAWPPGASVYCVTMVARPLPQQYFKQLTLTQLKATAAFLGTGITICMLGTALLLLLLPVWPVLWIVGEALFFLEWCRRLQQLNKVPEKQEPDNHDGSAVFAKFLEASKYLVNYITMQQLVSTWFRKVPVSQILRMNTVDLMTYGFWYRTR